MSIRAVQQEPALPAFAGRVGKSAEAPVAKAPVIIQAKASFKPLVDPAAKQQAVKAAIELINKKMQTSGQALNFAYDEVADHTIITVKNSHTGEVVRQLPSEAALRIAHNIEAFKGFLLDKST
jgi:flagellar protein FlaG